MVGRGICGVVPVALYRATDVPCRVCVGLVDRNARHVEKSCDDVFLCKLAYMGVSPHKGAPCVGEDSALRQDESEQLFGAVGRWRICLLSLGIGTLCGQRPYNEPCAGSSVRFIAVLVLQIVAPFA